MPVLEIYVALWLKSSLHGSKDGPLVFEIYSFIENVKINSRMLKFIIQVLINTFG